MMFRSWGMVRIIFSILLLLAMGSAFFFVLPRYVDVRCGIPVAFGVDAISNTLCRIEYQTADSRFDGCVEFFLPAGKGEAKCFISTQVPLRKIRFAAPGVKTGVVRLIGTCTVVCAADFTHLPAELNLQPSGIPYWRWSK